MTARRRLGGPALAGAGPAETDGERRYLNRELSTLDFNGRVLALAENPDLPLLERIKFLAIFSTNTDEFFQVRVAGLKDQEAAGISGTAPDGLSVTDQLAAIRAEVVDLFERRRAAFLERHPARGWPSTASSSRTGSPLTARTAPGSRRCSPSGSFRC